MEIDSNAAASLDVIDVPDHCGNAPRKAVVRDLAIALVVGDRVFLEQVLHADFEWTVNGEPPIKGVNAVWKRISNQPRAHTLEIFTVLTHGTECAVDGKITFADGSSRLFGHFLRFTGGSKTAKVKVIRTYFHATSA